MVNNGNLLRQALLLDAMASGLMGIVMAAAPGFVAQLLNLPMGFVLYIGIFLIGFAAALLVLRRYPLPALVWLVIVGNAGWVLASIAILFTGLIAPNTLGIVVIAAQALAVAVFAELEFMGQRRTSAAVA
ncbi:MAG: hypothetical protein K0S54_329 [Alphaproteobacteria bacterium]|jgi:hypothetical protein|nr:hypothetical protein [Alphaproteobacteria bacterium]